MSKQKNSTIQYRLAQALYELSLNDNFDDITVNEICNAAHVARATYYHYVTGKHAKEQLLKFKIKQDYKEYLKKINKNNGDDILAYIYEHKDFFSMLYKNKLSNIIISFLKATNRPPEGQTLNGLFIQSYVTYGYLGVIYQWAKNDFQLTPTEVETIIYNKYKEILQGLLNPTPR